MIKYTDKEIPLDPNFLPLIDSLVYNVNEGWDFLLLITGSGLKRVGKSMLAQQLAYIISHELNSPFGIDNVVFGSDNLIETAKKLPRRSVIIDDESRADFNSSLVMSKVYNNLANFMSECGMYNHIIILVAPDFFSFSRAFATLESVALINLVRQRQVIPYRQDSYLGKYLSSIGKTRQATAFKRGLCKIYNAKKKIKLYEVGKKNYSNYDMVKADYKAEYRKKWVLDEQEYENKKLKHLERERVGKINDNSNILKLLKQKGATDTEIATAFNVTRRTIINWKQKAPFTMPSKTNIEKNPENLPIM